jgi:L-ascorbate metabolism protein UlaG (beta-lactamase superfamily)
VRLTKYPQSCLVVEHEAGGRLLIDPGNVAMDAHAFADFGTVDAVLFTHAHPDHFDPRAVAAILDRGLPIHANADVCGKVDGPTTTVGDGDTFTAAGFQISARDMTHVQMVDGSAGPPNTGYVLDGRLLHPGDSLQVGGLSVDAIAVPIAGPSVSFRDSYVAVERTGASTAVPIHYDVFLADPWLFTKYCDVAAIVVLGDGESADL